MLFTGLPFLYPGVVSASIESLLIFLAQELPVSQHCFGLFLFGQFVIPIYK